MDLVRSMIPDPTTEMNKRALLDAQKKCIELGLTSVVDCGLDFAIVNLIDSLHKSGELKMRINAMLNPTKENFNEFVSKGPYVTERLSVRSIKVYADGALGSRGALLFEPYTDDSGTKGLLIESEDYYREICELANKHNYQVCIHAIGDKANQISLKIYGETLKEKNDKRWRIEHAQIIHPDDFKLFEKYSIIPSVQPTHATSDMYWAKDRIGAERLKGAYAYKQLLETNNWIISGTDFPVEKVNPLYTFYAAIGRKDRNGWPEEGFQMENVLSRKDALRSMTIWAAKGSFEENVKGSIEVGKLADFVVLEQDIMTQSEYDMRSNKAIATYIGGKKMFSIMQVW
jgi:predicted amidohydrolase YtcJ